MEDIHAASDVIRKERGYQNMVTDEIMCAVQMMVGKMENPKEKNAGEKIGNMLADFDEDLWNSLSNKEKDAWIYGYVK